MNALSETSKTEFFIKISTRNFIIEIIFLALICVYELNTLASLIRYTPSNLLNIPIEIYFLIHMTSFIFYIIILSLCMIFKKTLNSKKTLITHLTFILVFFICLWSVIISLLTYNEITLYTATLLTTGFIITLTPKKSIFLFSSIHFIFITLFLFFRINSFNCTTNLFNTTIIIIVSIIISNVNYQNRIREFTQLAIITEQNKSLNLMVMKDSLTDLYNRYCFDKTIQSLLEVCIVKKTMLSVLMLDIDDFKCYNDSFGHQAGDNCLIEVAKIIKEATDTNSGIAYRYGGEEFTLIFTGLHKNEVMNKAEFIRKAVETLMHPSSSTSCNITISTGIFHVLPNEHTNFNHCLKVADTLLYKVKELGKNKILIQEEFN